MVEHPRRIRRRSVPVAPARSAVAVLLVALVTAGLTLVGPAATGAEPLPAYHPSRLTSLGDARQVVVVTARSWSSSTAVLRTWQRTADGGWRLSTGPVPARVGYNGFVPADERRQGTGTSPAGTFAILSAFGNGTDPGTALAYRAVDRNDWWAYDPRDPSTYNVLQPRRVATARWRTSWAEDLSAYGGQYRFAAVLDFNLPGGVRHAADGQRVADQPADTRLGGGIFLHVSGPGATAGCVSVPRDVMRRVLRWLDPAAEPVLVMGPRSAITRL
jgi:L,D-peptidoglycan transpeptidase YkuD (ErfK/YbiS/YcfS/YnhG family)